MTKTDLRDWQDQMGYTWDTAAEALGISRSGYGKRVLGQVACTDETALACAALAAGLQPWGAKHGTKHGTKHGINDKSV